MKISLTIAIIFGFLCLYTSPVLAENIRPDGTQSNQKVCPVSGEAIGAMGPAAQYEYNGTVYHFCCAGCIAPFKANPEKYIQLSQESPEKKTKPNGHAACSQTDSCAESSESHDDNVRVYEVFGMDCPGCHQGLEKLVKKIPAVKDAQANWKKKTLSVIIHSSKTLNDEDVYDAIARANLTVNKRLQ